MCGARNWPRCSCKVQVYLRRVYKPSQGSINKRFLEIDVFGQVKHHIFKFFYTVCRPDKMKGVKTGILHTLHFTNIKLQTPISFLLIKFCYNFTI